MSRLTRLGQRVGLRSPESDDGGLSVQQVGPAVRGLMGVVGLLSAGFGMYMVFEGQWHFAVEGITAAALMGWIAARGIRKEIDAAASERFLELADPSRPLPEAALRPPSDDR